DEAGAQRRHQWSQRAQHDERPRPFGVTLRAADLAHMTKIPTTWSDEYQQRSQMRDGSACVVAKQQLARTVPVGARSGQMLWIAVMISTTLDRALAGRDWISTLSQTTSPLEDAMFQVDPWEKAAECERARRLTLDPLHRENLTNIREFWISLARQRRFLSEREFAT